MGAQVHQSQRALLAIGLLLSFVGCGSARTTKGSGSDAGGTNSDGTNDGSGGASSNATSGASQTASSGGAGGHSGDAAGTTGGGDGSVGSSGGASASASTAGGGSGGADMPACPGFAPRADVPGTTCRSPDDCDSGATCDAVAFSGCGACINAERECEGDEQCDAGERCVEFASLETCACSFELASQCRPACTATSCGDGEECDDEVCRPRSCENGFACDVNLVCAPGRVNSDVHGCAPPNCTEGRACEPGYACDAESGECRAVHCSEEGAMACPINTQCDAQAAGRGCSPKSCDADTDCDCGVCIHSCTGEPCPPGQCAGHLYLCNHPVP